MRARRGKFYLESWESEQMVDYYSLNSVMRSRLIFVPPNDLRETKVRPSPRQSSLMHGGRFSRSEKQTGSNQVPLIICKQVLVEDSVENGYESLGNKSFVTCTYQSREESLPWSPVYLLLRQSSWGIGGLVQGALRGMLQSHELLVNCFFYSRDYRLCASDL